MTPKLYVLVGPGESQSFNLEYGKIYTIGRSPNNDIKINDINISRYHLKIRSKAGKYFIADLNSKNGTFFGGKEISPGVEIAVDEGVPIVIGMTVLGLGEVCETSLKPFLDSVGICSEICENGEVSRLDRVVSIKKNLEFIYNVINVLMGSKDINEILEKVLDNIFNLLNRIDRCVIVLIDDKKGEISKVIYRSKQPVEDTETLYSRELVEHSLLLNKAVMVVDSYDEDDEDDKITKSLQLMKIRSAMCVPMCSCSQTRGAIYVDSIERPYGFRRNDIALLKDVSSRTALAMDNIALKESLEYDN